jgi:hypothetical protein
MTSLNLQDLESGYRTGRTTHVKRVHCHHGMARPRVADRGDGLQIWRVVANMLNKHTRTADRGWSSSLGVGRGPNKPHLHKTKFATKRYTQPGTRTDSLALEEQKDLLFS